MNRKLKPFLALLVYSFSEGGKARPEALKTDPGHLARSPHIPSCYVTKRFVNPIAYSVSLLSRQFFTSVPVATRTNFNEGDEFRSLGFLAAIAYSEGMLCSRKLSLFLILI